MNACGSETLFWKRVNKFNPRRTEVRLLGIYLKSSRYIVVEFLTGDSAWPGRSREPTLTTDGKLCHQEMLSQPPIWSQRQRNSLVREELGGEVNPAAQRLERHPVDALLPDPNRDPFPRRLYLKQCDFMAHGTSDRCPGCRALVSGGRAHCFPHSGRPDDKDYKY